MTPLLPDKLPDTMPDALPNTIGELSALFRARSLSPVEATRVCLERIAELNPRLNAFITVTADAALAQAHQAEAEILHGQWRGALHGVPIGLKDLIDTAGVRTTAGSAVYLDRVPAADAELVRRLRLAGAVILGKQNLHEFAYGGSSMVSCYGEVQNPWDTSRIAGGSSGGSAASVAAGLGYAAIGTDTAGSIRLPAACCGVVGLKPTYGRVSARGVIPLSRSLDHVGPIARSVHDAALVLQAIAGYDSQDATSRDAVTPDFSAELFAGAASLRVGVLRSYFWDELDPEIRTATEHALATLAHLGAELLDLEVPVETSRTLQAAESYEFHAKSAAEHPELYQPETLRRIQSGAGITAAESSAARQQLERTRKEIGRVFERVDLLVTPTTPILPPAIAELKNNPERLRPLELTMLRNTRPFNVWGLPAVSIPCGFSSGGWPIGLQIAGPHWGEATVLRLAHAYESATAWHKRKPPLTL